MDLNYHSYFGVFLALIASTTIVPVPEELPVLYAGVVCGQSDGQYANDRDNPDRIKWWWMLPVVIIGAVLGDVVLYTLGRLWGPGLLSRKWVQKRLVSPETRKKLEKSFAERGIMVLLGVRLLPGIRGPAFFVAGMVRLPLWQFLLADAIYAIPVVNLMFWTAYWLTDQVMVLVAEVNAYKSLVVSHILAAVAGAFVYKYLLSRHVSTGEQTPLVTKAEAITYAIENVIESAVDAVTGRHHPPDPGSGSQESGDKGQESGGNGQEMRKQETGDTKTGDKKPPTSDTTDSVPPTPGT
jgi:membrane protein DedA with SNARE-associated domain